MIGSDYDFLEMGIAENETYFYINIQSSIKRQSFVALFETVHCS